MKTCASCSTWIPDGAAICPSCGKDPGPAAPPPPAPPAPGAPGPSPEILAEYRVRTEGRIRALGTAYMALGGVVLLGVAFAFLHFASGDALRELADLRGNPDLRQVFGEQAEEALDRMERLLQSPVYLALSLLVPFGMAVLLVAAGAGLRRLRGRPLALAAAVLSIAVLAPGAIPAGAPLCFCCAVGPPFGIWALVVLTNPAVEAVLRGPRP